MGTHDVAMAAAIEEKMRPLRMRYFETVKQRLQEMERVLGLLVAGELHEDDDRTALINVAHKLAGTGATYGFPQISHAGRDVETALLGGMSNDAPELLALVIDLMNVCHDVLTQNAGVANEPSATTSATTQPLDEPVRAPNVTPAQPAAPVVLPTMLVLDDDQAILDFMIELFGDDARIITGTTAVQGLHLIHEHCPDLVLLDNMMPGGTSGLSLLESLQTTPAFTNLPVVMISASGKPEEVMRGLMAGAVDYITKPFDAHEMSSKVRKRLWRLQSPILVADDDESVRDLLAHKLRSAGCQVVCAADGAQAWEMLQKQTFALAVLDLMMPGYDGMTLLRMMKAQAALSDTPVIFLTARHLSADVLEGLNTGASDYITKPFNSDEVVTRCIRLLRPPSRKGS
jgi:DNA-binding response OmpR family regulator/HPt (histidine-containing phosphotransfer) domain-containing protein